MNFKNKKKSELVEILEGLFCSEKTSIMLAKDVVPFFRAKIGLNCKQEHFLAMYLDGAHNIIETKIIFIGTVNRSMVHPREIFAPALELRASAIIIGHNHPSGSVEPSTEDINMTKRLVEAGKILGIEILDHVIFTYKDFYSFQNNGHI